MKKLVVLFTGLIFLFSSCSYEPGVTEAMVKYGFKDGVTTLVVPGWAIRLIAGLNELDETEREIFSSIHKVKIVVVEDEDLNTRINLHEEFYNKVNKDGNYEELLTVRDDSENVTVFGRMDDSVIKEMALLIGGDDNAIVYVKGSFSPDLLKDQLDIGDTKKLLSLNF